MNLELKLKKNKLLSQKLTSFNEDSRIYALKRLSTLLMQRQSHILAANAKDVTSAKKSKLKASLIERLQLDEKKIQQMSQSCLEIAAQAAVVGVFDQKYSRPNGLLIQRQRIALGCILMIFESRPNVVIDAAALAIKSGNALILKGGKEAQHSNRVLLELVQQVMQEVFQLPVIDWLESRQAVDRALKMDQYIDLVIARGGSSLVQHVKQRALMPVICHDKGLCHLYVHADAKPLLVEKVVINAKTSRVGVCNALESLLIHQDYPGIKVLLEKLLAAGVEIRGCRHSKKFSSQIKLASKKDYATEYLASIISVKIVTNEQQAIEHIQTFGSHHTEAILAKDPTVIEFFIQNLDASCIMINTSTRFNDGGELGLGAELGISTNKLHVYGPMGAKEMTTTRWLVHGEGQIR